MFKQRQNLISLPGLMLAGCLVALAGCGGSDGSAGSSADSAAAGGNSPASVPASVPAAPANLTATAGNAAVSLQWAASTNATSYNVKRATTSGGAYTQLGTATSTTYTDSAVTNGTAYYYVVSALDTAGESANSAQASATPTGTNTAPPTGTNPPPPTSGAAPATPANLTATPGNAQVSLGWSASSGATSYHVKRATTSGGPYSQIAAPTTATYADPTVTNGTTYYYVVSALDSSGESANSAQVVALPDPPTTTTSTLSPGSSGCGMQLGSAPVVFCETFDAPAGVAGTRTGDLNPNVWGVSRTIGDGVNFGQGQLNQWNATQIQKCDGTTPTVIAPADIIICNGQLREASNDNNALAFEGGTVTSLAMYPKQPFDFAGRTGTVSFDVSNDTGGIHSAWPEFWLTDAPVPAPFSHFDSWESLPANGFGIRFSTESPVGMAGLCPNGNNLNQVRWTIDSAVVVRGYVMDDTEGYGTRSAMTVTLLDCVIEPSGPGQFNHVELRISQNQIDVYATDAGVAATPSTLRHIAVVNNANLTLSRGLIWLEDAHYNADKGLDASRPSQRQHTFSWDNVAFDGPFTDRDFAYDAPDNNVPGQNGSLNLGKLAQPNGTSTWNIPNIPANRQAAAAKVLFNFTGGGDANPTVLNVIVNGNPHSVPWPYPDQLTNTWRTFAVQVPLTDVVTGTNVVQLGADTAQLFSNVDLVLGDVTGGVPVLPGANDAYPD
jgi:hypothetical protein